MENQQNTNSAEEGRSSKAGYQPSSRRSKYPNKGGGYMKRIVSTVLVALVLITGMTAHMAEACRLRVGNAIAGYSSAEVGIPGDINMDGEVNIIDLSLMGQAWDSHKGDPHYSACADINSDGVINSTDLGIVGQHWGEKRFFTKCFPLQPGLGTPRDHIYQLDNLAWLTGSWGLAKNEGKILLDCKEVGAKGLYYFFSNCSRIRVLSHGDFIENSHRYKVQPGIKLSEYRTSTCIIWESVVHKNYPLFESWFVVIKDNGDHYVKLEISSCIGYITENSPPGLATQIIVIQW